MDPLYNSPLAIVRYVEPKPLDQFLSSFDKKLPEVNLQKLDFPQDRAKLGARSIRDTALLFPSPYIFDNENETHSIVSHFCDTSGGVTSGGVIGRIGQTFKKIAAEKDQNLLSKHVFQQLNASINTSHDLCALFHTIYVLDRNQEK